MAPSSTRAGDKQVAVWLFTCCAFIFLMVVVGGITRLTESGLSIVDWKPVTGALPPLSDTAWQAEFDRYRTSPEFIKKNFHMGVAEFKTIFWMEYLHRLLGRLIGMVFFLPLVYFLYAKKISRALAWKLFGIFLLGGLQGAMGWYMVKSGLVDDPRVSPYRLTAHLLIAFLIYALIFANALRLSVPNLGTGIKDKEKALQVRRVSWVLVALVVMQVSLGGLVAGNHAGLLYNTFPDMDGQFMPSDTWNPAMGWHNFFENPTLVQFLHRKGAYLVVTAVFLLWFLHRGYATNKNYKLSINLLMVVVFMQFCLGVLTLLHQVPVALGSLHQAIALVLFSISLFINRAACAKSAPLPVRSGMKKK